MRDRLKRTGPSTSPQAVKGRHQRFVHEYLANGLNAKEAAKAVGYSEKTAHAQGCRLMKMPKIREAIAAATEKTFGKLDISVEHTLREVGRLAFSDVRKLFEDDGSLKRLQDLDDDAAACIAGLEVTELFEGQGEQKHAYGLLKKIKIVDKGQALDKLMRYHALYKDIVRHTGGDGQGPIEAAITVQFVKAGQNDPANH